MPAFSTPDLLVFTSLAFGLLFFPTVLLVHWRLRSHTLRKAWLLGASYVFYAAWDWRFLGLILLSTAVDFACGLGMDRSDDDRARKRWLWLSLAVNLGLLGFFKYANFFVDSAVALAHSVGWEAPERSFAVLLPAGISFYTFQTLSYTIDVYRRRLEPTRNPLDFALFVAFFPQLVAGPIVRASHFLPQLAERRLFARVDVRACVVLFLLGYVKKRCLADNLAFFVDAVYYEPLEYTAAAMRLATVLFSVQIYCDFSGYSDMAIATAGLLGYRLPRNFDFPYLAGSVAEFWRRWHISLSTWLRDYLYVPLGGSRGTKAETARNLGLVMLLGGLWHGAGWNFVVWGALHGVGLIVHAWWSKRTFLAGRPPTWGRWWSAALTFAFVTLLWVPFRAYTFEETWAITVGIVTGRAAGLRGVDPYLWGVLAALAVVHVAAYRDPVASWIRGLPAPAFAAWLGVAVGLAVAFSHRGVDPFVYFQF